MKTLALSPKTLIGVLALTTFAGGFTVMRVHRTQASDRGELESPAESAAIVETSRAGQASAAAKLGRAKAPGLRHEYDVRFDQDLSFVAPSAAGQSRGEEAHVRLAVKGKLSMAFVAHVDGKHRLFAELRGAEVSMGQRDDKVQALERELEKPFYVIAETDGRVRGYSFARGLSLTAQNVLRGLVGGSQVAAKEDARYQLGEDDIHGSYRATYERDGKGELVKTKGRYDRIATMSALVDPANGAEVETRGVARARLGDDLWPSSVVVTEEKLAKMGENMPSARTKIDLALTLTGTQLDLSLLGRYERELAELVATGPHGTGNDSEATRAADLRTVANRSFDEIVADVTRTGDEAKRGELGVQLSARLRLSPEEAERAAALVKTMPAREGQLVVGSLGGAETPAAVRSLGTIMNDRAVPNEVRAQAATQLAFAGPHAALAKEPLMQAMSDASPDVRRGAALALGNVARSMEGDPDMVSELVERYRQAATDDERTDYLRALGNSGSPEVLPLAREALGSASEPLREAAAHALRFLPVGDADRVLSSIVVQDPAEGVRESAIDAMSFRVVEMFAPLLDRTVQTDPSTRVRREVVTTVNRALATRGSTLPPEARAQLVAIAEKGPTGDEAPLP